MGGCVSLYTFRHRSNNSVGFICSFNFISPTIPIWTPTPIQAHIHIANILAHFPEFALGGSGIVVAVFVHIYLSGLVTSLYVYIRPKATRRGIARAQIFGIRRK